MTEPEKPIEMISKPLNELSIRERMEYGNLCGLKKGQLLRLSTDNPKEPAKYVVIVVKKDGTVKIRLIEPIEPIEGELYIDIVCSWSDWKASDGRRFIPVVEVRKDTTPIPVVEVRKRKDTTPIPITHMLLEIWKHWPYIVNKKYWRKLHSRILISKTIIDTYRPKEYKIATITGDSVEVMDRWQDSKIVGFVKDGLEIAYKDDNQFIELFTNGWETVRKDIEKERHVLRLVDGKLQNEKGDVFVSKKEK